MNLVTLDFETYYAKDYSLSKMRTDAYISDEIFKVHSVQVKVNNEPTIFLQDGIKEYFDAIKLADCAVIGHNMAFDGMILAKAYGIYPKYLIDTLSMSRQINNHLQSHSLENLCVYYGLPAKNTAALASTMGVRDINSLPPEDYQAFVEYGIGDVDKTRKLFDLLRPHISSTDMLAIDYFLKMFTAPKLHLDIELLEKHLNKLNVDLEDLLVRAGDDKATFSSTAKFSKLLEDLGVEIPMKPSPSNPDKMIPALSKTDPAFLELCEHEDERVQLLCAARLGTKSTQARTRCESMIDLQRVNNNAPILLNWAGASATTRSSGGNKMNFQNMGRGSILRKAVVAPPGFVCVVVDSSNIEARVLDALAGQWDMMDVYLAADNKTGPDRYCVQASLIYGRPITPEDVLERQVGKTATLGLGFGMGGEKFHAQLKLLPKIVVGGVESRVSDIITLEESSRIVKLYREVNPGVKSLWYRLDSAFKDACSSHSFARMVIDELGVSVSRSGGITTINLFDKLKLNYSDLHTNIDGEMVYYVGKKEKKVYGGLLTENITQAVARQIVTAQMVNASKRMGVRPSLFVHDEAVWVVPENKAEQALSVAVEEFRRSPTWLERIVLNGKGSTSRRYGDAK